MRKVLLGFGAGSFGVLEDFDKGELLVQFTWKDRPVQIKANSKGYAAAWLKQHPWSPRMRATVGQYEERALKLGQVAVYSILRDWIKGQVTAIEVGMLSFESAFLGQLLLKDGRSVMEHMTNSGMLAITDQKGER